MQSNLSDLLGPPCRPVAATAKDARQAEQIAEVVPGSVVVDLVDTEVAFEKRGHEHKWRNKTLPEAEPEACDCVVFARRSFEMVSARRTSGQNVQQY